MLAGPLTLSPSLFYHFLAYVPAPPCRFCSEPPGDPGEPAGAVQAAWLPARDAGVRLPQADHQGHRVGAQGQQLHQGQ